MACRLSSVRNACMQLFKTNNAKYICSHDLESLQKVCRSVHQMSFSDIKNVPEVEDTECSLKTLSNPEAILERPKSIETIDLLSNAPLLVFNLAAYANTLPIIQKLVELEVPIHRWDDDAQMVKFVLNSNFKDHFEPFIKLFQKAGVPNDKLGLVIAKFKTGFHQFTVQEIEERINYLESKKFDNEQIGAIISKTPYWLFQTIEKIDTHLGKIQKLYSLSGSELRHVASIDPKFVLYSIDDTLRLELPALSFMNEMGYTKHQTKKLLLDKTRIFRNTLEYTLRRYHFLTSAMGYHREIILEFPGLLDFRETKMRQRHGFLTLLKRDQYDPKKPNYITPEMFMLGKDGDFAEKVCKASPKLFDDYLKTL